MRTTIAFEIDVSGSPSGHLDYAPASLISALADYAAPFPTHTYPNNDGRYLDVEVVCHVSPGERARTYGPPEDCYPGSDPDVWVDHVLVCPRDERPIRMPARLADALADHLWPLIEEQAICDAEDDD